MRLSFGSRPSQPEPQALYFELKLRAILVGHYRLHDNFSARPPALEPHPSEISRPSGFTKPQLGKVCEWPTMMERCQDRQDDPGSHHDCAINVDPAAGFIADAQFL